MLPCWLLGLLISLTWWWLPNVCLSHGQTTLWPWNHTSNSLKIHTYTTGLLIFTSNLLLCHQYLSSQKMVNSSTQLLTLNAFFSITLLPPRSINKYWWFSFNKHIRYLQSVSCSLLPWPPLSFPLIFHKWYSAPYFSVWNRLTHLLYPLIIELSAESHFRRKTCFWTPLSVRISSSYK